MTHECCGQERYAARRAAALRERQAFVRQQYKGDAGKAGVRASLIQSIICINSLKVSSHINFTSTYVVIMHYKQFFTHGNQLK